MSTQAAKKKFVHLHNILSQQFSKMQDEQLVTSYRKDPRRFIEGFLKIRDRKTQQIVPFRLKPAQVALYKVILRLIREGKPVRILILKARQMGISTLVEALIFIRIRLWERSNGLIVSHDTKSAEAIFNMTQLFHDSMPPFLKPMQRYRTKKLIRFENPKEYERHINPGLQSEISIETAKKVEVGRGSNFQAAHLSEAAFWADAENTILSIMQATNSPDSWVFIESTAKGATGSFYDMWNDAVAGASEWYPLFLPYCMDPDYADNESTEDELDKYFKDFPISQEEQSLIDKYGPIFTRRTVKWRRYAISNLCGNSITKFNQEYPETAESAFFSQGETIFDHEAIAYYRDNHMCSGRKGSLVIGPRKKPMFKADPKGHLEVWKPPMKGRNYVIGADTALGVRTEMQKLEARKTGEGMGDFSTMEVLDVDTREQVAEYRCNTIDPFEFANCLAMLGHWYNTALLNPEAGGFGGGFAVIYELKKNYPNLWRWEKWDRRGHVMTSDVGFEPMRKSSPIMESIFMKEVRRGAGLLSAEEVGHDANLPKFILHSRVLLSELTTYTINRGDGSTGARKGSHDDLVISMGLALVALEQAPQPRSSRRSRMMPGPRDSFNSRGTSNAVTGSDPDSAWYR